MIATDRFCDGDPTNNADVDRTDPGKRHGGDLLGIVQRMPYLKDLGVTVLWITPVYLNPANSYHGYHPLDFEQVEPHLCSIELGSTDGRGNVRRFIEIAHEHGLKVMLDIIVSHTAIGHPWITERPDWFDPQGSTIEEKWWLWGLPHLNQDNIDVNLYFAKNVLDWIADTGADAIRIDAARHVEKRFWTIFKLFVKGVYPSVTVVGEVWDGNPFVVGPYQEFYDFDSMFDYPLYGAMVDVFVNNQSFQKLARPELADQEAPGILDLDGAYRNARQLVTFIGNHDNPRFVTLAGGHDSDQATARVKLALTFLFTARGIPQLYYGDELAMAGGADPDNRQDMPWNLVDDKSLEGLGDLDPALDMLDFTRKAIKMRLASKALCSGLVTTLYVTHDVYAFARTYFDDIRIVVLNNSSMEVAVTIPITSNSRLPRIAKLQIAEGCQLFDCLDLNKSMSVTMENGTISLHLAAKSALVLCPSHTASVATEAS